MQGAVKALGAERRSWAALENGQLMIDSFDYRCCLPVLGQLSVFNSRTCTRANSSVIVVLLEEGNESPLQWQGLGNITLMRKHNSRFPKSSA